MSEGTENTDNVKRLLDSLNEYLKLNTYDLNQLDTSDERVLASFSKENFQMISGNAEENELRLKVKRKIDKNQLEKLKTRVEYLENVLRILRKLERFTEEPEKVFVEEQNAGVQEREDKKDFKMRKAKENEYVIPEMHNQNEYLRQSPEYPEQHKTDNTHYNDLNNIELKYNTKNNLPHCPVDRMALLALE